MRYLRPLLLTALLSPCALALGCISAPWTPVQVGFFFGLQAFDEETEVRGLRVTLARADNARLDGLDVAGFGNAIQGPVRGAQLAVIANEAGADVTGFQLAAGNSAGGTLDGVQLGFANGARSVRGLQIAMLGNRAGDGGLFGPGYGDVQGAQIALVNEGEIRGLQLGGLNWSYEGAGVQLGLVNVAGDLTGPQIGLLNFNREGFLPFFPILNFSVGGGDER